MAVILETVTAPTAAVTAEASVSEAVIDRVDIDLTRPVLKIGFRELLHD